MEILEFNECFPDAPGEPVFTIVVFNDGDQLFTARATGRYSRKSEILAASFDDRVAIPTSAFQPQLTDTLFLSQVEPDDRMFVKRPSLLSYYHTDHTQDERIADDLLREAQVYEKLRSSPHDNVVQYIGCEVKNGRISGLCLPRYKQSLMQRLNPGSLGKRAFANSCSGNLDQGWCQKISEGIRAGLNNLHSLGLVHNDLNPSNILLDDQDIPRIVDFGSCRPEGESLTNVGRTYEWYNEAVQEASKKNDLDALAEIDAWMEGRVHDFKFME